MFIIEQRELLKAVKITAEAIRTKTLLESCYMDIAFTYRPSFKDIKMFASCGDFSIAYYLEPYKYEIKKEFNNFRVNYKKLLNCVDSFDKDCKLSLSTENGKLKISEYSRKVSYSNIVCNDLYEYPEIELLSDKASQNLQAYTNEKALKEMLKNGNFAIAEKDEVRTVLKGTLFEFSNKDLKLITANGRMLCITGSKELDKISKGDMKSCIIGREITAKLEKLLSNTEKHLSIYWTVDDSGDIKRIEFMFGNIVFQALIIESGKYPNWRQMENPESYYKYKFFVSKKELDRICIKHNKFFAGIADERADNLNITSFLMNTENEKLTVESKDYNEQSSATDEIEINNANKNYKGTNEIFLDISYVQKIIKNISREIYFKVKESNYTKQPLEIVGEDPNKFRCILMPISVKKEKKDG
jgi:hypothetical protein